MNTELLSKDDDHSDGGSKSYLKFLGSSPVSSSQAIALEIKTRGQGSFQLAGYLLKKDVYLHRTIMKCLLKST